MDPETLARMAAQSLVSALVTQAAAATKAKFAKLLSRRKPATEVAAELEQTQTTLADRPEDRTGEEYFWKREFASLISEHPDVKEELRALLDEARRLTPNAQTFGGISHHGSVGGDNIQVQASGGVTIGRASAGDRRGWRRR